MSKLIGVPTSVRDPQLRTLLSQLRNIAAYAPDVREIERRFTAIEGELPGGGGGNPGNGVSYETPTAITGFEARGTFGLVFLIWDTVFFPPNPQRFIVGRVEVWRNTVDDRSTAVLHISTTEDVAVDFVESGAGFYYWVRAVSTGGVPGPFNAIEGTYGKAVVPPEDILAELTGQILNSHLHETLSSRIALIDEPGGLVDQSLQNANDIITEANQRLALAQQLRGDYTGTDPEAVSTGLIYQERVIRENSIDQLASQMALLTAGAASQFDYSDIWYFDAGVEGWTSNGGAPTTPTPGWIAAIVGANPWVQSPAITVDSTKYPQVRARIKRIGTPAWQGALSWYSDSFPGPVFEFITIPEPAYEADDTALLTWNVDWAGQGDITTIRLDLASSSDASNYFEIDWVAIGRPAPGASSAELFTEQQARISADDALASDITILNAQVADKAEASAVTALDVRVTDAEDELSSQSTALTQLSSTLTSQTELVWSRDYVITSGARLTLLTADGDPLPIDAGLGVSGDYTAEYIVTAVTLGVATRTQTVGRFRYYPVSNNWIFSHISALGFVAPHPYFWEGLGVAQVGIYGTTTRTVRVTVENTMVLGGYGANAQAIEANSTALSTLSTRVNDTEDGITANSAAITQLESSLSSGDVNINGSFSDVAPGAMPAGYIAYGTGIPNSIHIGAYAYSGGKALEYITNTTTARGLRYDAGSAGQPPIPNMPYIDAEVTFTITSGATLNGMGLLFDWVNTGGTTYRTVWRFNQVYTSTDGILGRRVTLSFRAYRPSTFSGTFDYFRVFIMLNYAGEGFGALTAKTVYLDRVSLSMADASATAIQALDTRVTQTEDELDATSTAITQISTRLDNAGGASISVEEKMQSNANSISGLSAQYSVKIDNNGNISGFGLSSESVYGAVSSAFMINADRFSVVNASTAKTVTSLTRSGSVATASVTAHGLTVGDKIALSNVYTPGWNGTYTVASVLTANSFTFAVSSGLSTPAVARITIDGKPLSSLTRSSTTATAVFLSPHGISPGDAVSIAGASVVDWNGTYTVTSAPNTTSIQFTVAPSLATPAAAVMRAAELTVPFVVDSGQVIMDIALIKDGTITSAKINTLDVVKVTGLTSSFVLSTIGTGNITNAYIGSVIQSNVYSAGSSGWHINKNGFAEFQNILARGNIEATSLKAGNIFTGNIQSIVFSTGNTGWRIQASGAAEFNDVVISRPNVVATGTFVTGGTYGFRRGGSGEPAWVVYRNDIIPVTMRPLVDDAGRPYILYLIDTGYDDMFDVFDTYGPGFVGRAKMTSINASGGGPGEIKMSAAVVCEIGFEADYSEAGSGGGGVRIVLYAKVYLPRNIIAAVNNIRPSIMEWSLVRLT